MKKFKLSDILSETSITMVILSIVTAIITFGVSTPIFILSLIFGVANIGVVAGTAIYNSKQFNEQDKKEDVKETQEAETLGKLETEQSKDIQVEVNNVNAKKQKINTKKIK